MFTTPCFIRKNTKELQDKLSNLGYSNYYDDDRSSNKNVNDEPFLFVDTYIEYDINSGNIIEDTPYYCCINADDLDGTYYGIDCGDNEELFLSIAALRDDSDLHQYFILDCNISCASENFKPKGTFILCKRDTWFRDFNKDGNVDMFSSTNIPAHKATVEELIEHFK